MIPPGCSRRLAAILLALIGTVALSGCQTPLERAYGRSQQEHVARSIENPEAGQEEAAVASDGASAENALTKHRAREQQVEESQPESVITINAEN